MFLFVITLIIASQADSIIMALHSVSGFKNHQQLFNSANDGLICKEQQLLGKSCVLVDTTVRVHVAIVCQHKDACGNKILDLKSVATGSTGKLILQVRDIFARVTSEMNCRLLPRFQRIWWQEE